MRIVSMSKVPMLKVPMSGLTLIAALVVLTACGGGSGSTPEPAPFATVAGTFSGFRLRTDNTNPGSPTLATDDPAQLTITPSGVVTDDLDGVLDGELRAVDPALTPDAFELKTNAGELILLQFNAASPNYFTMLSVDRFGVCLRGLDTQDSQSSGLVGDGAWVGTLSNYDFFTTGQIAPNVRHDIQAATAELGVLAFTFALQDVAATFSLSSTAAHPPLAPFFAEPFRFIGEWTQDPTADDGLVVMLASPDGNFLGSLFVGFAFFGGGSFNAPDISNLTFSLVGNWLRN